MKKIEYTIPELTEKELYDIAWTSEEVESLPLPGWVYKIICLLLHRKKLTYQELFMLVYGMNKNLGEKKAKEVALYEIIRIYEKNNNKLPEGVEHERT